MRRSLLLTLAVGGLALAGTRAAESDGIAPPTLADGGHGSKGVRLADSVGCRMSIRMTDGGTVNGGKLVPFYYDEINGWVPSHTELHCTLKAALVIDAGAPSAQVCPDMEPLARFGRLAVEARSVTNLAGDPAGGTSRVECWGPEIP